VTSLGTTKLERLSQGIKHFNIGEQGQRLVL
jgi:hypothetical protein